MVVAQASDPARSIADVAQEHGEREHGHKVATRTFACAIDGSIAGARVLSPRADRAVVEAAAGHRGGARCGLGLL